MYMMMAKLLSLRFCKSPFLHEDPVALVEVSCAVDTPPADSVQSGRCIARDSGNNGKYKQTPWMGLIKEIQTVEEITVRRVKMGKIRHKGKE